MVRVGLIRQGIFIHVVVPCLQSLVVFSPGLGCLLHVAAEVSVLKYNQSTPVRVCEHVKTLMWKPSDTPMVTAADVKRQS